MSTITWPNADQDRMHGPDRQHQFYQLFDYHLMLGANNPVAWPALYNMNKGHMNLIHQESYAKKVFPHLVRFSLLCFFLLEPNFLLPTFSVCLLLPPTSLYDAHNERGWMRVRGLGSGYQEDMYDAHNDEDEWVSILSTNWMQTGRQIYLFLCRPLSSRRWISPSLIAAMIIQEIPLYWKTGKSRGYTCRRSRNLLTLESRTWSEIIRAYVWELMCVMFCTVRIS